MRSSEPSLIGATKSRDPVKAVLPSFHVSRRSFVKQCAALAAILGVPLWYAENVLRAADTPRRLTPNDRPGIALVGCGGMGKGDALNASNHGEIVAVCDVDDRRAQEAAEKLTIEGKRPRVYSDFREVMADKNVHVILNATPDHWHTLINIAAAKAGKDVYSEKPLTLTIDEGRHVIKAVRDAKIVLQTGTQQRSSSKFRLACELVRNRRIGALKTANVWLPAGLNDGPFAAADVPAGLNWDYWLGQAPKVAYVPERCHGRFRYWYDYSAGTLTDWGAHHNDIAYWAIGEVAPREISGRALSQPVPGGYSAASEYEINYTYASGIELVVRTTTDDSIGGEVVNNVGQRNGIRFEGSDGWIWVNRDRLEASDPELLRSPLAESAVHLYSSKDHMQNFFDCVRSRALPICDVETGHRSSTICHLGAIALRTGKKLNWDSDAERFVGENAEHANPYVSREMRAPYDYSWVT
jgi:predicted dehydrogenase